ncbi:unnamed protein product [Lactuca virosa]|uniref:PGG domain-containing protein n=1 Tax=Lactuca virosa TaxID=75947 RepID=A0AAU9NH41_9ASTR|nr:unnamed protein product [Lactuca virosa]
MAQTGVQLASIDEQKSLTHEQQQDIRISVASQGRSKPIPDLLNGTSKENMKIAIPLYEASIRGDWKAAKEILDKRPELVRYSVTGNNETALHVAASTKSTKQAEQFVENLMTKMEKEDLELKNNSSNTALCLAAAVGNVKMVELMVKKCRALVAITGSGGMTPLYMAALFGHSEVVKYLYKNSDKLYDDYWTPQNRGWLLQKCVENDMFDIALDILREHEELSSSGIVLAALARKTDAFAEIKSNIIMRTIKWVICTKMQAHEKESKAKALEILKTIWCYIAEKPREEIDTILRGPPDPPVKRYEKPAFDKIDEALQLLKLISDNIVNIPVEIRNIIKGPVARNLEGLAGNVRKKYSSRVLFVATEVGNTRFVVELIRLYPDLAWKVNDNNQSIFHVAARHRQADIYNLLHEIGLNKDMITPLKDLNEDNMLHLVARSVERKRLEDVSGGAFQMQRELLWFKEVEKMVLPSYRERKNKDGLTPREIFTKEHQDLVVKAFTVPGGYDQTNGIPFFRRNVSFLIFVVADAISLFSSSASILTFLSILTSRYAEDDFLESLPRKLMLGLATLYLSITTMMIAFSVTFFVLYREHLKWIPILITVIATTPVLLFAALQYRLLKDVIHSTYGSSYLFRSNNHLYNAKSNSNYRCFPFRIPFISRCTSKIFKLL